MFEINSFILSDEEFNLWIMEEFCDDNIINDYMQKYYIPSGDLSISNFREFIEKRNEIIKLELSKNLK
ncbi:MAG: hypothetical protein RR712_04385 [Terrisporobacter sp.]